jgi:protein-disulfide isomerase
MASKYIRIVLVAFATSIAYSQCWSLTAMAQSTSNSPPAADKAIQQAIHDYILDHPEVLIESLQIGKLKEEQRRAAVAKSMINSFKQDLTDDPLSPTFGNPKGDVTVVEFFDYRCPYCRQVEGSLQTLIKDDQGVRVVQKEFPILGAASLYAARVALAAQKQGKHLQLHDALMAKKPNIDERTILEVAKAAGLNMDQITVDMMGSEINSEIARTAQIARALKLNGTPAFIIGTALVPGFTDLETLKSLVDDARHGLD